MKAEQLPISLSKIDVYIRNYMEFIYTLNEVNKHTMRKMVAELGSGSGSGIEKEIEQIRAGEVRTCLYVQCTLLKGVIFSSEAFSPFALLFFYFLCASEL